MCRLQLRKEIPERERRFAVLADDDRGDPLIERADGIVAVEQRAVGVAVSIDKTRGEREAVSVHDAIAIPRRGLSRLDGDDAPARYADGGSNGGAARAVEHRHVRDEG